MPFDAIFKPVVQIRNTFLFGRKIVWLWRSCGPGLGPISEPSGLDEFLGGPPNPVGITFISLASFVRA